VHRSALRANGMADNNNLGSDFAHYEWADQKLFSKVLHNFACSNLILFSTVNHGSLERHQVVRT
jgi:hypothetical protein